MAKVVLSPDGKRAIISTLTTHTTTATSYNQLVSELWNETLRINYAEIRAKAKIMWVALEESRKSAVILKENATCSWCNKRFFSEDGESLCSFICVYQESKSQADKCQGCRDNELNQMGHMYPGGCLYIDPYADEPIDSPSNSENAAPSVESPPPPPILF